MAECRDERQLDLRRNLRASVGGAGWGDCTSAQIYVGLTNAAGSHAARHIGGCSWTGPVVGIPVGGGRTSLSALWLYGFMVPMVLGL